MTAAAQGPVCAACTSGFHRECAVTGCDCAVCRTFREAPKPAKVVRRGSRKSDPMGGCRR